MENILHRKNNFDNKTTMDKRAAGVIEEILF